MNERFTNLLTWSRRYIRLSFVAMIAIIVYVVAFSDNSIMDSYEYQKTINSLEDEISQNRDTLEYYQLLNEHLQTDPQTMERIVREQYHMQRPNEDVYIIN